MDKPKESNSEKRRTRLMATASAVMFLIVLAVGGGFLYRSRQAQIGDYGNPRLRMPPGMPTPEVAKVQRKARHAKAEMLRDKWRVWAVRNKDAPKRMRAARPGDKAALMAVWNAIPGQPEAGVTGFDAQDLNTGVVDASWQPTFKTVRANPSDPKSVEQAEEMKKFGEQGLHYYFDREHDVMLSWISDIGPSRSVHLWASGRITEQQMNVKKNAAGKVVSAEAVQREIAPPYDFLK